jgi:hypothetical protein
MISIGPSVEDLERSAASVVDDMDGSPDFWQTHGNASAADAAAPPAGFMALRANVVNLCLSKASQRIPESTHPMTCASLILMHCTRPHRGHEQTA